MIKKLHIQTIDSCNANCIMCPNSIRKMSNKIMSDEVFLKIVLETLPYMDENSEYLLFLQNEPLLDKQLFNRAKLIKSVNKKSIISIFTNGILLDKYKEDLQYLDHIFISMYGDDAESYNKVTHANITQEQFDRILDVESQYLNVEINNKYSSDWETDDDIKLNFSSRAGFLSNDKILTDSVNCSKGINEEWLHFLVDGSVIACCFDYVKESVMGNIKHQSLEEIFDSKLYKTMINKVKGIIKSENDFICKKCEKNIPKDNLCN